MTLRGKVATDRAGIEIGHLTIGDDAAIFHQKKVLTDTAGACEFFLDQYDRQIFLAIQPQQNVADSTTIFG